DPMELMRANQCTLCHIIDGEGGPIGPALDDVGSRLDADGIRHSILQPNADTASGYEAVAGTMPATFGAQLTAAQLEVLVEYLRGRQ
ncbi:MAG: c-type cytochrome, partial [Longimicrobiales bacterium]